MISFSIIYKIRRKLEYAGHFVGSVAYGFRDVLKDLCSDYELTLGKIMKNPMEGLVAYYNR